jgi:hypothetical protein
MKSFGPVLCGIAQDPNFMDEYVGKFETEFKNILGY